MAIGDADSLAKLNELWQAASMGNKDARRREKKKPKQKKAKREELSPGVAKIQRAAQDK